MLDRKSGFQAHVKAVSPSAISIHCFIHRFALAGKLLPPNLKTSLNLVVKMANYIKTSVLNSRLSKVICEDMLIIAILYGCEMAISGKYCYASFRFEKRAASVLPNKRSRISEGSGRRKLHSLPCLPIRYFWSYESLQSLCLGA